jgi:hypothetical protein
MFENTKKLICCATNQGLIAGLWHGTKLQTYAVFNNVDEDHTAFSQFLSQYVDINIYLIVDAIEEDYKVESLPHTAGKARREIIERKLNQFNRNSLYRAAHFINRATDKRKDDNFLFVSLNNDDFLHGWIDAIQANHAPLVGVYMLPMISQVAVRQMKLMAQHILLCERLSSGLRQTYLHNGRLRMSRLVPMQDVKPNQLAYFYLVEIDKTRLYLSSQRLIANETALQLVLPGIDGSIKDIARNISQEQGVECKIVDMLAYAKNSNIAIDLVKKHPEFLHMQMLANGNVPDNLAPANYSKVHGLNNLRRKINIATGCIATLGVMLAAFFAWQGNHQKEQMQHIVAQTQQQQKQYEDVAKNFPSTPIPGAELKVAADIAHIIKSNNQTPRQLMQVLSSAFEASPEIALNRMRWTLSNNKELKDEETASASNAADASAQPVVANIDPTKLLQIGFINAEIRGFTGDYRAALNSVNKFVTHLREDAAVDSVVILQEPVNVSSLANLQGSTTDENATTERPPAIFKLKIILKVATDNTNAAGAAL